VNVKFFYYLFKKMDWWRIVFRGYKLQDIVRCMFRTEEIE